MERGLGMSKPLWFDITLFAPDRHTNNKHSRKNREVVYRHINFMVHLLWGVPYHGPASRATVHGPVHLLANAMKQNVSDRDWPTEFASAAPILKHHLPKIIKQAGKAGNPAVSDLYFGVNRPDTYRYAAIIEACRCLRDELEAAGFDICLPFIEAYDSKVPPDSNIFSSYSTKLTNLTLMDLYINPVLSGTQKNAVGRLIRGGVFRPRGQQSGISIEARTSGGQGNGYRCKATGQGCDPAEPSCYCSTDSAGNCSAMTTCSA
jgi:hypothetical protein